MIPLNDIPEMIDELRAGNLTPQVFNSLCLDLLEHHEVETVLGLLPVELRDDLITDMSSFYDNDIPAEDFLLLSSARGDHPAKLIIIDRVRRWLKTRQATAQNS
jgi:hypothetical protein